VPARDCVETSRRSAEPNHFFLSEPAVAGVTERNSDMFTGLGVANTLLSLPTSCTERNHAINHGYKAINHGYKTITMGTKPLTMGTKPLPMGTKELTMGRKPLPWVQSN